MLEVMCPHCQAHIYNMIHPPISMEPISAADFLPASPDIPPPRSGDKTDCPLCGAGLLQQTYLDGLQILTNEGWLPE